MRSDEPTRDGAHEEALLIPWYCNGTLARDERERVERHLESCARCREDLELWRSVDVEVRESATMPVPHPAQLQRLVGRLDEPAAEAGEVASTESRRERSPELSRLPRRWRLVLVAQAAALVALVGWTAVSRLEPTPAPAFRTLSARAVERPSWRLRAVFSEQTPEREMRALLLSLGAAVVDGPSPLGVYTVEIPATLDPESTIAVLRTRPEVRFAELAVSRERR